jgi:transposase
MHLSSDSTRANNAAKEQRPQFDWRIVHRELRCKGVTLLLLWEEYRGVHGYARYCGLYPSWCGRIFCPITLS